jgi:hypothetical protein
MTAPAHVAVRGSRLMAVIGRPSVIRLGGIAGLLAPLPVWGAAAISLAVGPNLRQYGFPWAAALAAVLAGACTIALTGAHAGQWGRGLQVIGVLTAGALLGVAGFFAALGLEDLIADRVGGTRFLSDNDAVTAVGTLAASVLSLLVLPVGFLVLGVAILRSAELDRTGRLAAAALAPLLVLAALIGAATASAAGAAACLGLFGMCWFLLGRSLLLLLPPVSGAAPAPSVNS